MLQRFSALKRQNAAKLRGENEDLRKEILAKSSDIRHLQRMLEGKEKSYGDAQEEWEKTVAAWKARQVVYEKDIKKKLEESRSQKVAVESNFEDMDRLNAELEKTREILQIIKA